jgi:ABC-type maltose transport system permease subunit
MPRSGRGRTIPVLLELGRHLGRLHASGLAIAIPAAWAMAFVPGKRTKDLLMWMLSTKMMPAVAVMIPIYLIFQRLA